MNKFHIPKALPGLVTTAGAALLALVSAPAVAGEAQNTFQVTATVVASCEVGVTSDLAFGDYNPLKPVDGSNGQASTQVNVTCTNGTDFVVALNYGSHGGSASARFMSAGGGNKLAYNLYTHPSYTSVWKDKTVCNDPNGSSASCAYGTGDGSAADTFTVYGRIKATDTPVPGAYSDTVTVTVTF